jgi:phosphosulfolactate phosphohydrolase-like enzyme
MQVEVAYVPRDAIWLPQRVALLITKAAGMPLSNFVYGNVPVALANTDLRTHELAWSTTNGTKALVWA